MKNFNINEYMYIQITEEGWKHLENTVGIDYINICIKHIRNEKLINGETWYKLQCWECFSLLPPNFGGRSLFNSNVMFDEESFK